MHDRFPPQGRNRDNNPHDQQTLKGNHPQNDKEMRGKLMTMAKDLPAVFKTLNLVKVMATYEQNTKNLTASNKDELKKTYGFLLGSDCNDPRVKFSSWKV